MSAALLDREARSLVQRLRVWTPQRWAAAGLPGLTRGDVVHHLAASFVAAAGETTRPLPRLAADLALPDQLAVTAHDLVLRAPADSAVLTAHLLLHRSDLLGDDVPAGLAEALGLADVLAAGRGVCDLPHDERTARPVWLNRSPDPVERAVMTSLTARPGAADLLSPFDVVAHRVPAQRRTKRELLTASRVLERRALAAGVDTVLVTFQDRRHLTPASRDAYAGLARGGATVHAFARGLVSDYRPGSKGLSHVALLPSDPLALEWDIVVLGRTFSAAFVARDLTPGTPVGGADLDRPFSWTSTEDTDLVEACARHLLSRLP